MDLKACLIACVVCSGAVQIAWADGVVRDSVGAVAAGRGGTNIAFSDNAAVLLDNPAGIINVPGDGLIGFGIDGLLTDLDYSDPMNDISNETEVYPLPYGSIIGKSDSDRFAYGLGFFVPAGFGSKWRQSAPLPFGGTREYDSLGALSKILPTVAYRVNDRLSIGGSFGVAFSQTELEGPFFLQTGLFRGAPTHFNMKADGVAPTWSAGLQYLLTDQTTIGLAYTSETRFQLDGRAETLLFGVNPLAPEIGIPSQFDVEADLVWPRSLGLGLNHAINPHQRVSLDVVWYDWSHAFDHIDLVLSNASNPLVRPLGSVSDRFDLDWKDSISVRAGYEHVLSPTSIGRLGYTYTSPTVPSATLTTFIPATLEHTFSVGYGKLMGDWQVDAAYQYAFGPELEVGQSDIVGGDFDNSDVNAQAHWFYLGFTRILGPKQSCPSCGKTGYPRQ